MMLFRRIISRTSLLLIGFFGGYGCGVSTQQRGPEAQRHGTQTKNRDAFQLNLRKWHRQAAADGYIQPAEVWPAESGDGSSLLDVYLDPENLRLFEKHRHGPLLDGPEVYADDDGTVADTEDIYVEIDAEGGFHRRRFFHINLELAVRREVWRQSPEIAVSQFELQKVYSERSRQFGNTDAYEFSATRQGAPSSTDAPIRIYATYYLADPQRDRSNVIDLQVFEHGEPHRLDVRSTEGLMQAIAETSAADASSQPLQWTVNQHQPWVTELQDFKTGDVVSVAYPDELIGEYQAGSTALWQRIETFWSGDVATSGLFLQAEPRRLSYGPIAIDAPQHATAERLSQLISLKNEAYHRTHTVEQLQTVFSQIEALMSDDPALANYPVYEDISSIEKVAWVRYEAEFGASYSQTSWFYSIISPADLLHFAELGADAVDDEQRQQGLVSIRKDIATAFLKPLKDTLFGQRYQNSYPYTNFLSEARQAVAAGYPAEQLVLSTTYQMVLDRMSQLKREALLEETAREIAAIDSWLRAVTGQSRPR